MKNYIYISLALAATMFTACGSDDEILEIPNTTPTEASAKDTEFTIIAQLPENSITRLAATDNSSGSTYGMDFAWENNEYIQFYYNTSSGWVKESRPAKNITDGTATFTLASGKEPSASGNYLYATKLSLSATEDSKGSDSSTADIAYFYIDCQKWIYDNLTDVGNNNPMFGAVQYSASTSFSSTLIFKNVCALLKFDLTLPDEVGTITGVDIYGYNTKEENLTFRQNLKVTGSTGIPEFIDDAVTYKTTTKEKRNNNHLSVSSKSFSVTSNKITLYAFIIPQSINGIHIKLTDSNSATYTKSKKFDSPQTLDAGKMYGVKVTNASSWSVSK